MSAASLVTASVAEVIVLAALAASTAHAAAPRTLLLVDDDGILYRAGVRRVLHPLARHPGNPVVAPDRPWERGTIAYCSVHRDPAAGGYRMWYQAWTPDRGTFLCYATSRDGLRWEKPSLGVFEFGGNRANNILMRHGFGAGVLVDPRDPAAGRRYKLAYWDHNGTCVAFSPDGIHWTKHDRNPVIRGSQGDYIQPPLSDDPARLTGALGGPPLSTSDVTDPIWDPVRGVYAIYAKTWLDGPDGTMHWKRAVVRTDSKDFLQWSKPVLVAAPDEVDDPAGESSLARTAGGGGSGARQFHSGPTFFYRGLYFMQLQVLEANRTGEMPDELALSRDGYHFARPFRETPFLGPLQDKTRFDASIIWSNATPVVLDDEIRFYYGAYGRPWNSDDARQTSGIGLSTLPRDRFAGLRPTEKIGQVTLREVDLGGVRGLSANADAAGGSIRVELLDAEGYRVRGFSREDCIPIRGDALRHAVRWRARGLDGLGPGKYRLRIHLDHAEVFAVTLER